MSTQIQGKAPVKYDNPLRLAWQGRERLWVAYWVILGMGSFLAASASMLFLPLIAWFDMSFIYAGLLTIPYMMFGAICVWRCAFNSGWKGWGYLARLSLLALPLTLLLAY